MPEHHDAMLGRVRTAHLAADLAFEHAIEAWLRSERLRERLNAVPLSPSVEAQLHLRLSRDAPTPADG